MSVCVALAEHLTLNWPNSQTAKFIGERLQKVPPPYHLQTTTNIVFVGSLGVGKSSIINYIVGVPILPSGAQVPIKLSYATDYAYNITTESINGQLDVIHYASLEEACGALTRHGTDSCIREVLVQSSAFSCLGGRVVLVDLPSYRDATSYTADHVVVVVAAGSDARSQPFLCQTDHIRMVGRYRHWSIVVTKADQVDTTMFESEHKKRVYFCSSIQDQVQELVGYTPPTMAADFGHVDGYSVVRERLASVVQSTTLGRSTGYTLRLVNTHHILEQMCNPGYGGYNVQVLGQCATGAKERISKIFEHVKCLDEFCCKLATPNKLSRTDLVALWDNFFNKDILASFVKEQEIYTAILDSFTIDMYFWRLLPLRIVADYTAARIDAQRLLQEQQQVLSHRRTNKYTIALVRKAVNKTIKALHDAACAIVDTVVAQAVCSASDSFEDVIQVRNMFNSTFRVR